MKVLIDLAHSYPIKADKSNSIKISDSYSDYIHCNGKYLRIVVETFKHFEIFHFSIK